MAVNDAKAVRAALVALAPLAEELGRPADKARYAALLDKLDQAQAGK